MTIRLLAAVCLCASLAFAQKRTSGITTISGSAIDFSGATTTKPFAVGSSDPASCSEGEAFYNSTSNLFKICTATNTWEAPTGGGSTYVAGSSGGITINTAANPDEIDIDTAVVPRKSAANVMTGLNTFDLGYIDINDVTAPSSPSAGYLRFYADSADGQLKCKNSSGTSCLSSGGGAPTSATYITQTADGTLSNEQALSSLSTGLVKVTTGTGVLSTASASTDYVPNPGGDGIVVRNGSSANNRTITAGQGITVTNGSGTAGNPTIAVNSMSSTAGLGIWMPFGVTGSSTPLGTQASLVMRCWQISMPAPFETKAIHARVQTAAGSGATGAAWALYDAAGALLGQTAALTGLNSGAGKRFEFASTVTLTPATYYVCTATEDTTLAWTASGGTVASVNDVLNADASNVRIFGMSPANVTGTGTGITFPATMTSGGSTVLASTTGVPILALVR